MIREHDDLRRAFRSRKVTMCLESYVDILPHARRNLAQACGDPVARLLALRTGLDLVGENANQRRPEFHRQLSMSNRDLYLLSALTRVRRMKHARSINTTNLNSLKLG